MRTDLWELFERFSRHEIEILTQAYPRDAAGQLPGLDTEPATFHQLCVGLAMYRNEFPLVNLPASMTDGLGDFSLDAIALMLGPDPVFSADEADELLDAAEDRTLRILFVQAKRWEKVDEKEVIDFGVKVTRFLTYSAADIEKQLSIGVEDRAQDAAENVLQYWRAYDALRKKATKVQVIAVYAFSGDYTAPPGVTAAIAEFEHNVKSRIAGADARMLIYGADELLAIGREADTDVMRRFEDMHLVELPPTTGAAKAYIGYVGAQSLVDAIRPKHVGVTADQKLPDARLFFDNPRAFIDPERDRNIGVASLRKTLAQASLHDRVILGHNGLLIAGDGVALSGTTLEVQGTQILNGLQSCHALFEFDGRLEGVSVPVKVFATQDEALKDALILASNTQQAFGEYDMLSRKRELRNLQPDFEINTVRSSQLWLRLKPAEPPRGIHSRNLTPRQLLDGFIASYLGQPHTVHTGGERGRTLLDAGKVFAADHEPNSYRALGWLIVRGRLWAKASGRWAWQDYADRETRNPNAYPARHQFTYALWRLCADDPDDVDLDRSPVANRRFQRIVDLLRDDRIGLTLAQLAGLAVQDACGGARLTQQLARTAPFTVDVRDAATKRRQEVGRQALA